MSERAYKFIDDDAVMMNNDHRKATAEEIVEYFKKREK